MSQDKTSPTTLAETSISVSQAQQLLQQAITPIAASETISISEALGRVLAQDVISTVDVPPHDNSAMDGFAFRYQDLAHDGETKLNVKATVLAGHVWQDVLQENDCVRIMTGALMPNGCDTVIPIEQVQINANNSITIRRQQVRSGDHCRLRGEDIAKGSIALKKGRRLTPADIGLIASLGIATVMVHRALRVAFFSTGDELSSAGTPALDGQRFDSNRFTIAAMLKRLGCMPIDMGIVKDDPASIKTAFEQACLQADAVITSGGISVGDADHTRKTLQQLGEIALWSIAMRPGRPFAFGHLQHKEHTAYWFGLPGNPVAVMVSFYFLARPALLQLAGSEVVPPLAIPAVSLHPIQKRAGRTEFLRGIVTHHDGQLKVITTGEQGSGILRSMSEANCIIVLPHEQASVAAGELVNIILFEGLL